MTGNSRFALEGDFMRLLTRTALVAATVGAAVSVPPTPAGPVGPPAEQWQATVRKGADFLKSTQDADGSWSKTKSPGITGLVVTALLRSGQSPDDPPCAKGL